jgi:N-acetylmuramic acid 6-phosphate etherase
MTSPRDSFSHLSTEQPNPKSQNLDKFSPLEFVDLMQSEDHRVLEALQKVRLDLAEMIDELARRFREGGRLFYAGAGTSGRLGMLDATECPPTFGVSPSMVQAILAGGAECLVRSVEGAEDDESAGSCAVGERGVTSRDMLVGIAASGATPFVRGALRAAARQEAYCALLACHSEPIVDFPLSKQIILSTGPEVLAGSTRLKAGTATKLFLNRLTTGAMIQIGKVYRNRMVDLYLTCDKLRARAIRTTREFTGLSHEEAIQLLEDCGGSVKTAILAHCRRISGTEATRLLDLAGGHLRKALGEPD